MKIQIDNRLKTAVQGVGADGIELNTDLTDGADAMLVDDLKQKQNKNSLWGQLSCFESLMLFVSAVLP